MNINVGDTVEVALTFAQPKSVSNWAKIKVTYVSDKMVVGTLLESHHETLIGTEQAYELMLYDVREPVEEVDRVYEQALAIAAECEGKGVADVAETFIKHNWRPA